MVDGGWWMVDGGMDDISVSIYMYIYIYRPMGPQGPMGPHAKTCENTAGPYFGLFSGPRQ